MNNSNSLWRRLKEGNLDYQLAGLQLTALISAIGMVTYVIFLYRHFTDDALIDLWDYLSSVKVAIPPLAALVITYLYAFVTGINVTEAPKAILAWIRDDALQNHRIMTGFVVVSIIFCTFSDSYLRRMPAPAYERLVAQLLGGENDDQHVIEEVIRNLKEKNRVFATRIDIANQIFAERRRWNHENKQPIEALPRAWIRALDVNLDEAWKEHPLRWHASAEAHAMMTQAIMTIGAVSSTTAVVNQERDAALMLYQRVLDSRDSRVTPLLRKSAAQNLANVYLYTKEFQKALDQYDKAIKENRSLATESNRVVALVQLGRFAEAISKGTDAQAWALDSGRVLTELRDYISLISNKGFVHLITGANANALKDMREAFELLPDIMARQNLGLAYIANKMPDEALEILAEDIDAPNVTATSESEVMVKHGGGSCTYLIRGIASIMKGQQDRDAASNLAAYLRRADTAEHLASLRHWRKLAWQGLQKDKRPCNSLQLIPVVKNFLTLPVGGAING